MTMTNPPDFDPNEPDVVLDAWDQGGDDLNALCAQVELIDAVDFGIHFALGEPEEQPGDPSEMARVVVATLIARGLLKPEWYGYDEDTQTVVTR